MLTPAFFHTTLTNNKFIEAIFHTCLSCHKTTFSDITNNAGYNPKRAIVTLQPESWSTWLHGSVECAVGLLKPLPAAVFNAGPVQKLQALLL